MNDQETLGCNDKLIGYTGNECIECGRYRVEIYESGIEVCEKCGINQYTKEFELNGYYSPFL